MSWHHVEDKEVKARKKHQCCLCGYRIRKGAKYIRRFGYDSDAGPVSMRMHAVCEAATRKWEIDDWENFYSDHQGFREFDLGMRSYKCRV